MDKKFVAVVVVAILLAVVAIGLWAQVDKLSKENAQLTSKLTSAQDESRQLQGQVNTLTNQLAVLRSDYATLQAENERLKSRQGKKFPAGAARG